MNRISGMLHLLKIRYYFCMGIRTNMQIHYLIMFLCWYPLKLRNENIISSVWPVILRLLRRWVFRKGDSKSSLFDVRCWMFDVFENRIIHYLPGVDRFDVRSLPAWLVPMRGRQVRCYLKP